MGTEHVGTAWMLNGFQAQVTLWIWSGIVLLYGLWRSFGEAEPDPVRAAGPID